MTTAPATTQMTPPRSGSRAELACYVVAGAAWIALLALAARRVDLGLAGLAGLVILGLGAPIAGMLLDSQRRAVAQREFLSFFYTPVGYVVLAVFSGLAGLFFFFFSQLFEPGRAIDTSRLIIPLAWFMVPITPAISMRLFAEEQRSGNLEALVTAPLTDTQLVLGKWIGALGFLAVSLGVSLVLVLLLEVYGSPDYGPIFTGYIGLVLLGGLFLAIGAFASTLTHNQIIAFLATLIGIAVLTFINGIVANNYATGSLAAALRFVNPIEHNNNFALGILDTSDFIFYISAIALFLVFAVKALESRKWR